MEEALIKRVMPHDEEAESSVIGAMLIDNEAIMVASELITGEDFYQKQMGVVYDTMVELYNAVPKEQRNGKCQIVVSTSFFVPKPFTPFQWAPMNTEREFLDKAAIVKAEVRAQLNQKSIRYIYHEADISLLEGFLARGDRKCAEVIEKAYRKGAIFDAWSEYFRKDAWEEAFAETGIDVSFYACRKRSTDEILPWDFLDIGVTKKFLIREWERAQQETVTPNCKMQCSGCGAKSFGGGVCYENQN